MQTRQEIYIVDIELNYIPNSAGESKISISNIKSFMADIQLVGQSTFWTARASNIILEYTVKIRSMFFNNEKYCFFGKKVYKIESLGKTDDANFILLNLSTYEDSDNSIKDAIGAWINAN